MAYRPNYNLTDVEIPAFLNDVQNADFIGSMNRFQINEQNQMKLRDARRQEESKQALAELDMEMNEELRDKEIQKILAASGDLEGLSQYRESKAREEANKYMARGREVEMLEALRNQPQDMIGQFLEQNKDLGYQGVQSNPDVKTQNLGGTIAQTTDLGGYSPVDVSIGSQISASKGGGSSKEREYKSQIFARPTKDGGIEVAEIRSQADEDKARNEGYFPEKMVPKEDPVTGLPLPKILTTIQKPEVTNDSGKVVFDDLSPDEQRAMIREYKKRGGTPEQFEALIADQRKRLGR